MWLRSVLDTAAEENNPPVAVRHVENGGFAGDDLFALQETAQQDIFLGVAGDHLDRRRVNDGLLLLFLVFFFPFFLVLYFLLLFFLLRDDLEGLRAREIDRELP